ncbi:MAG: protein kinase [Tannerella sp.]|jgi:serine/threonine-protein kinase|nr:protein kinase [Tannerella sp.]
MPSKVVLKINKGSLKGQEFTYDCRTSLVLGRGSDCTICFDDKDFTISHYHCYIDINPPTVVVRDLGSLNGTYLNSENIGQRSASLTPEEAQKLKYREFSMNSGDRLSLGESCEIELSIHEERQPRQDTVLIEKPAGAEEARPDSAADRPRDESPKQEPPPPKKQTVCAKCSAAIEELRYKDDDGRHICRNCYEEQERMKRKAQIAKIREEENKPAPKASADKIKKKPEEKPVAAAKANKCSVCGKPLDRSAGGANICAECRRDPSRPVTDSAEGVSGLRRIRLLGKGGMGEVWLVEEEKTGDRMALKVMLPEVAKDEPSKRMFMREAYTGCALEHENVVRHHRVGRLGDMFYILMEYCRGGSVDNLIKSRGGSMGSSETDMICATSIMLQVLDGLYHTHNATVPVTMPEGRTESKEGVVHRDFKPGNIFIANEDLSRPVAKVADFGLAKAFDSAGMTDISGPRIIRGSIGFMPRQQARNCRYAKPEVDIWAAAASYYNMLTGALPRNFEGEGGAELIHEVLTKGAVPIRRRDASVPEKLASVIDAALIDNPDIGIHKMIGNSRRKFDARHPEALALKQMIWESLSTRHQGCLWDILPPVTKKNIDR